MKFITVQLTYLFVSAGAFKLVFLLVGYDFQGIFFLFCALYTSNTENTHPDRKTPLLLLLFL